MKGKDYGNFWKVFFHCVLISISIMGCGQSDLQNQNAGADAPLNMAASIEKGTHFSTVNVQKNKSLVKKSMPIKKVDWAAYEQELGAKDYQELQKYLPVLSQNSKFTWLEARWVGKGKKSHLVHKKTRVTLRQFIDKQYKGTGIKKVKIILNSIAFCDVFQSGSRDLILHLENVGWEYLILHYDNGKLYGVDVGERCFQRLQEDGMYQQAGGAYSGYWYRMNFQKGDYSEHLLAEKDSLANKYKIGGKKVTRKEYFKWEKKHSAYEVKYHTPATQN